MTTTKMRRGKRSLAAILAAMLIASVLAVVAGSPAQAANTAFEVKKDDAREFAGQDRYDTALRLAKNFAEEKGGLGAVPVAFIASGNTLVDSISAAGFAGYADAPILLTPTGSLHDGVADFIEDYDVDTVYVLGGSAAVTDDTVSAIEGLQSKSAVTRIGGDDRYATAAAVSAMIETDSSWCGTDAASAVLINGSTDMLSYGVAVQTTVFRLQLPLLMTAADELPDSTADFIRENDIEHVQIIGGTDTVSAGVASALTSLGVDTVARVDGGSASAVSVELAKMANNGCGDDLAPVSTDRVVLVRGNPDGVAAAPVLALTLANGELVTPLIVGGFMPADSLPASVCDYLAATPKVVNGSKLNLGIVAVGGLKAISQSVMDAAVKCAASTGGLTVSIGATTDTNMDMKIDADDPVRPSTTFSLYFSDDVTGTADELLAKVRDIVEVNGAVAQVATATTASITGVCTPRRVDVTLTKELANGDTISIADSAHTFGTQDDQRRLAAVTPEKVVAVPADTTRPRITIIGIANEAAFQIRITEAGGLASDAEITADDLTFTSGKGTAELGTVTHTASELTATVAVTRAADAGGNENANTLVVGDRLTIKSGALADTSENVNASTTGRAIAEPKSPRITSVLLSNPLHSAPNVWTVPDSVGATGVNAISITAKASGDAAGAAGNAWSVVFDTPSTYSAEKASDIDVRVDTKGKTVTVRFVNGPATVGSLLAALKANSAFDERFSVTTGCDATATTALTPSNAAADRDAAATATGAGRTQFAIEVRFGAYIVSHVDDELLADILARTLARNRNNADADTQAELIALLGTGAGTGTLVGTAPSKTVRYEMETASVAYMPMNRDRVLTLAGAEAATDADANKAGDQARSLVEHVATGYAPDDPNEPADESKNGKSDLRISQTGSVKARNP